MKRNKSKNLKLFITFFLIAVFFIAAFIAMNYIEKNIIGRQDAEKTKDYSGTSFDEDRAITYNGVKYKPNPDIETILLIGLDKFGKFEENYSEGVISDSDFLVLIAINNETEQYTMLPVNRDTMSEVTMLDVTGENIGTRTCQLSLAYTYGNGLEQSCINTVNAVSDFLCGLEIDNYLTMNMDAVSKLNDLIGGVTVEVLDDFPDDTGLIKGQTVTLTGDTALRYVRGRKDTGDQTNISRMKRQAQYINAFTAKLKDVYSGDDDIAIKAYKAIDGYFLTNLSVNDISEKADKLSEYSMGEMLSIEGESVVNDYVEFYADSDQVKQLIIDNFYIKDE